MAQFYHTKEDRQSGRCLIYTIITCTHNTYIHIYVQPHIHICKLTLFHHTELISVLLHEWRSFTTLGKTNNEGGALSTTIIYIYTHIRTHTHAYTYTYIYIYIYSVSPHRVSVLPHRCPSFTTLGKIYTCTLFHHTELISILPHKWPSFTILGKTNSEGGALSTTIIHIYTHTYTYTHVRTYTYIYTYIYRYLYSVSPHRVTICFTTQMSQFYHTGEDIYTCSVLPHRVNICFTTQMPQFYHTGEDIYTYSVSPHRVNICFTTQMTQFYRTGEDQQRRWCLIYHHHIRIHTYVHTRTHPYIHIHIFIYIYLLCFTTPYRWPSFTTLGKIYTPTLFRHTELISVLPHRWPTFTTLGKTNNLDGASSTTIIYIYSYTYIRLLCFTTQS